MVLILCTPAFEGTSTTTERFMKKDRDLWSQEDKKKAALNGKARSMIIMALPDDIYHSVINYTTAKEIWDTLVVLFEGNTELKNNRPFLLIQ